jgi:NADPH:quinone reductase
MWAVGYSANRPPEDPGSLVDVRLPRPVPGPRDLLVEVRAVSVNPADVKARRSDQGPQVRVLGFDGAGVVAETGSEVRLFAPGDEVYYAGSIGRPGTNAEFHLVDERIVARKPTSLSFAEAAALPLTSITAWEALFDKLKLTSTREGTLFVVGASGGVGLMVLQLAKALLPGVRVIATSSAGETEQWVRQLGAQATVDYRADQRSQLATLAPSGVEWIFTSHVAGPGQIELYVDVLKPFGEIVAIDDPEELDVAPLKPKSLSMHWELMFTRPLQGGDGQLAQHRSLVEVAALVDAGRIRSTATTVLSPIDASTLRQAHGMVEAGQVLGKVVVAVDAPPQA